MDGSTKDWTSHFKDTCNEPDPKTMQNMRWKCDITKHLEFKMTELVD